MASKAIGTHCWEWECSKCGGRGWTGRDIPECPLCGKDWKGRYRQVVQDQTGHGFDAYFPWKDREVLK
jgi:hypothetical protein